MNPTAAKIRVLVVDDCAVDRMLLEELFSSDPRFELAGTASSGAEAILQNAQLAPAVIVMDVTMADMDGLEATAQIMHAKPAPIVICTGLAPEDANISFRSIEAGALALVGKPVGPLHPDHAAQVKTLTDTVANMSEVKVVRRWRRSRTSAARPLSLEAGPALSDESPRPVLVAIGASTGGPPVLRSLIAQLPAEFPLPILVVQHIATGFLSGMVSWLEQATGRRIHIARPGERPLPGEIYLAPDHHHMGIDSRGLIVLQAPDQPGSHCPSVARLFQSIALARLANRTIAILLTGMGADGAEELLTLRRLGATTIAQDEESSAVHGMPGEAIRLGAAMHVHSPEGISALLAELTRPLATKPSPRP